MAIEKYQESIQHLQVESAEIDEKPHEDRFVHYTHEMPAETQDGAGRFVVRTVPLLYGFLVGGLTDNLTAGLLVGGAVSVGSDLTMGEGSLFRPVFKWFSLLGCSTVASIANGLARVMDAIGLTAPSMLKDRRCDAS